MHSLEAEKVPDGPEKVPRFLLGLWAPISVSGFLKLSVSTDGGCCHLICVDLEDLHYV